MIEKDSSSGQWHRSHRLQSYVRGKGWQLRWITARHMVSSKRQFRCRQRMTLYVRCYDFIVLHPKYASQRDPSVWIDSLLKIRLRAIYIEITVELLVKFLRLEYLTGLVYFN